MSYPVKLLEEGEQIELDLHPHWKRLVAPVLVVLVVIGGGTYLSSTLSDKSWHGTADLVILVVGALLVLAFSLVPYLKWASTHYVVTSRRVVIRTGFLSRTGRDIPLSRVNDVTFSHTLFERMLGCGTLTVESAGERGQVVLVEVPKVEDVQRTIYRLGEADDLRRRSAPPPPEAPPES